MHEALSLSLRTKKAITATKTPKITKQNPHTSQYLIKS
jgi:hypothetical protein